MQRSYRQQLTDVLHEAAARLRGGKVITALEAATWQLTPGRTVIWRGATELPTQPIAELAEAMGSAQAGTYLQTAQRG